MKIQSFRLENFRTYKDRATIEGFTRIMAFIGQNNVGKSNVIRALTWYKDMALKAKTFSIELLHSNSRLNPLRFEIEFQLDNEERHSIFDQLRLQNEESLDLLKNSLLFQRVKHEGEFISEMSLINETISISDMSGSWLPILGYSMDTHMQLWKTNIENVITNYQAGAQDISTNVVNKEIVGPRIAKPERVFDWHVNSSIETRLKELLTRYIERWIWISPLRGIDTIRN